jgi:hypothetical protein
MMPHCPLSPEATQIAAPTQDYIMESRELCLVADGSQKFTHPPIIYSSIH